MTNTLKPFAYFACNPHTLKPVWSEDCVCQDDVYSEDETGTIGRPIVFVEDAEAYTDAKVRAALEDVAKMVLECDPRANHRGIAIAIRAIIPPTE